MDDTKAMIIQHEGIAQRLPNGEYEPYQDTRGLWTIGVGHLIGKGKTLPPEMDRNFSHEEVMNMFDDDFAHHKKIAEQTPGYGKANEAGKSAFVDLAFNMGKWWPKFPNAAKALGEGNFSLASNELCEKLVDDLAILTIPVQCFSLHKQVQVKVQHLLLILIVTLLIKEVCQWVVVTVL